MIREVWFVDMNGCLDVVDVVEIDEMSEEEIERFCREEEEMDREMEVI